MPDEVSTILPQSPESNRRDETLTQNFSKLNAQLDGFEYAFNSGDGSAIDIEGTRSPTTTLIPSLAPEGLHYDIVEARYEGGYIPSPPSRVRPSRLILTSGDSRRSMDELQPQIGIVYDGSQMTRVSSYAGHMPAITVITKGKNEDGREQISISTSPAVFNSNGIPEAAHEIN